MPSWTPIATPTLIILQYTYVGIYVGNQTAFILFLSLASIVFGGWAFILSLSSISTLPYTQIAKACLSYSVAIFLPAFSFDFNDEDTTFLYPTLHLLSSSRWPTLYCFRTLFSLNRIKRYLVCKGRIRGDGPDESEFIQHSLALTGSSTLSPPTLS